MENDQWAGVEENEVLVRDKVINSWVYIAGGLLLGVVVIIVSIWYFTTQTGDEPIIEPVPEFVSGPGESGPFPAVAAEAEFDPLFAELAQHVPVYIADPETTVDLQFFIGNNDLFTQDLEQLRDLEQFRNDIFMADLERAQYSIFNAPITEFQLLGEMFPDFTTPVTRAFMDTVLSEIDAYAVRLQASYGIARPDQADPTFTAAFTAVNTPSFPSLESTRAYTIVRLLAEINPEYADYSKQWAEAIVYQTLVAGIHYPYSVSGADTLVHDYFEHLVVNQQFQADLAQARAEMQTADIGWPQQTMDTDPTTSPVAGANTEVTQ